MADNSNSRAESTVYSTLQVISQVKRALSASLGLLGAEKYYIVDARIENPQASELG